MTEFDLYQHGYQDAESIDVTFGVHPYGEIDEVVETHFKNFVSKFDTKEFYQIPKEIIDTILAQAIEKRTKFEYGLNEFYIEANACADVCEYLLENAQVIETKL